MSSDLLTEYEPAVGRLLIDPVDPADPAAAVHG